MTVTVSRGRVRVRDRDRGDRACNTDPSSHPSMCLFYRHNDFECPKDTKKTKICNAYQKIKNRGFEGVIQA